MFQDLPSNAQSPLCKGDFDFSDPFPNAPRALFLRRHLTVRLIQGLTHLLSVCRSVIPHDVWGSAMGVIRGVDPEKPLSPFLFALQLQLLTSIQNNNQIGAVQAVQEIMTLAPTSSSLTFMNVSDLSSYITRMVETLVNSSSPLPVRLYPAGDLYDDRIAHIQDAWALLKSYTPTLYDELTIFQNTYLITGSETMKAGSSFYLFGLVFLRDSFVTTVLEMIDLVVHEAAHLYLYALQPDDALILNPPDECYQAPLRADKRPLIGIFHAVFVLSRVIRSLEILREKGAPLTKTDQDKADERIAFYRHRRHLSVDLLHQKADFTPLGRDLLDKTEALLAPNCML